MSKKNPHFKQRFIPDPKVTVDNTNFVKLDEDILTLVAMYPYIRGTFIVALLRDTYGVRAIQKAIRKLFDLGHIAKMPPVRFHGSHVYYITKPGLTAIKNRSERARALVRKRGTVIPLQYYHSLMAAEGTQRVQIGARRDGVPFRSLTQILAALDSPDDKPMTLRFKFRFTFPGKKEQEVEGHITADDAFTLGTIKTLFVLMEAQRECPNLRFNLKKGSLLQKILAYEAVCKVDSKGRGTINQLGRRDVKVLFTFPTLEEAQTARAVAEKYIKKPCSRYLFGVQPVQDNRFCDPTPDTDLYDKPLMRINMDDICLKDLVPKHEETPTD